MGLKKRTREYKEKSPLLDSEADEDSYPSPSTGENVENVSEATPVRHSARTAGKALKYGSAPICNFLVCYLIAEQVTRA